MKAAFFKEFGSAENVLQIGDVETPTPKTGEVKVKLITSSPNPSDVKKRAGSHSFLLDNGLVIPHSDGAGIIEEVGNEVSENRIGERVWVFNAQYERELGTAAEYVCLPSKEAISLPDGVSF